MLIFCEVANHFVAVCKIWVVKGIVLVVECLNIINFLCNLWPGHWTRTTDIYIVLSVQYEGKKGGKIRNRYNQVPHLIQDTKWENNNRTIQQNKWEPRGQPFPSRWPQGSKKQTEKHDKHNTEITQMFHRSNALEWSVKVFYWRALTSFNLNNY